MKYAITMRNGTEKIIDAEIGQPSGYRNGIFFMQSSGNHIPVSSVVGYKAL